MEDLSKNCRCDEGIVYTPWITVKGVRLYRKNGKMWAFPCKRCNGMDSEQQG